MPFTKGHKINIGRIWSKNRNAKIGLALSKKVKTACLVCGVNFEISPCRKSKAKYCSNKCKFERNGKPHRSECRVCGKIYIIKRSRQNRYPTKFCSAHCHGKYRIYEQSDKFFRDKHGANHPMWGKKLTKEWKRKISENHADMSGKNSPSWRGGINPINDSIRKSKRYKLWSRLVKEKDNFICQKCGIRGRRLESDHIKPFSIFPELRFDISNRQTLCRGCHLLKCREDMVTMRKAYTYLWQT